jgi:predicted nucleic acid-binding protein
VIAAERSGQTARQMVETLNAGDAELAISVITVLEMAHGVARANSERHRTARQHFS